MPEVTEQKINKQFAKLVGCLSGGLISLALILVPNNDYYTTIFSRIFSLFYCLSIIYYYIVL